MSRFPVALSGWLVSVGLACGAASSAHAGFIYGQDGDGRIGLIDTTDGSVTEVLDPANASFDDVGEGSTNGLGFQQSTGDFYRSGGADNTSLYRNNTPLVEVGTVFGGAVDGSTYYGVEEGDGTYFTVDLSSGNPTETNRTKVTDLAGVAGNPLGDVVVSGDELWVSYEGGFGIYNLADGSLISSLTASRRYAGLAFVGSQLFGVAGAPNDDSTLYALGFAGTSVSEGDGTTVADGWNIYDAATVPLPAAAWLFLSGLAGVFGYARFGRRGNASAAPA